MAGASLEVIATSVTDHQSAMRFIVALWRYQGGQWV